MRPDLDLNNSPNLAENSAEKGPIPNPNPEGLMNLNPAGSGLRNLNGRNPKTTRNPEKIGAEQLC